MQAVSIQWPLAGQAIDLSGSFFVPGDAVMRTRTTLTIAVALVVGLGVVSGPGANEGALGANSPKGNWGRVRPIAYGNHPNLYYDQGEIEEQRRMLLVQHRPQHQNSSVFTVPTRAQKRLPRNSA
jgi:hypothetical protein